MGRRQARKASRARFSLSRLTIYFQCSAVKGLLFYAILEIIANDLNFHYLVCCVVIWITSDIDTDSCLKDVMQKDNGGILLSIEIFCNLEMW